MANSTGKSTQNSRTNQESLGFFSVIGVARVEKTFKDDEETEEVILSLHKPTDGSRHTIYLEFEDAEEASVALRSVASQFNRAGD